MRADVEFTVDSWEDAGRPGLDCIPELSGSVESRWLQLRARELIQAAIWQTHSSAPHGCVKADAVLELLADATARDELASSRDPLVASAARRAVIMSGVWTSSSGQTDVVADYAVRQLRDWLAR